MKKLFIIAIVTVSSINYTFSQVKSKTTPKFKLSDTVGTWNRGNLFRDSLKQEFIQSEIIKQFNAARIAKGVASLTPDVGLKPAAVHNAIYNRYCMFHDIINDNSEWTMTHYQNVDIPNFNEIPEVGARIKLLDESKFDMITEELQFAVVCECVNPTFQQVSTQVTENFKQSAAHWGDIINSKWDAVYVYYDLHATELFTWTNPSTGVFEPIGSMNVIIYVILATYKK
jgi:hypothetical protein